jgi:hypothetical protein
MMRWPRRGTGSGSWGVEAHAEYGHPVAQLGRFGRSVDLLVLGSHRHGHTGTGIGQRLADPPPCPLLVVAHHSGPTYVSNT